MEQSDNVKSTSGKIYALAAVRHHSMGTSGSLLLQENAGLDPEFENLRSFKASSLNLGLGAGKYWIYNSRYFAGALLDLLGTIGFSDYSTMTDTSKSTFGTLSYDVKLAVGYSGDVFKSGLSLTGDTTTLKTPGVTVVKPTAARALLYLRAIFKILLPSS